MPNYRYHTPEPDRRNYCGCNSNMPRRGQQTNTRPQHDTCEVPFRDCNATSKMSCAVSDHHDALGGMTIAMAYVPWQLWRDVCDTEKGFCGGTIFEELNKPFLGAGGVRK